LFFLSIAKVCKKPTESYGFDQSIRQYSLKEFGEMANKFKSTFFSKEHGKVTPERVEREFWRILSDPSESVTVEYGADLHTLKMGSGFPTTSNSGCKLSTKAKDLQDYIKSPWNLNNISQLDKSVLSQINADISGMKVKFMITRLLIFNNV
jgi:[histone H3]-trimethyl-L-lysine4 demethylase